MAVPSVLLYSDYIMSVEKASLVAGYISECSGIPKIQVVTPPSDCSGPKEDECVSVMTKSNETGSNYLDIARV